MAIGIIGRKCGMTRVFTENGQSIPVTVIQAEPNRIVQRKTLENEGYEAIQVTVGERRASRVNKPQTNHYAKAKVKPGKLLQEFRLEDVADTAELEPGKEITVNIFTDGQAVDVSGTSKGKGFAGVIKRHNFSTQDATHGNSLAHRAPGSTGQNQTPGRVFKGKKMAGQMGNKRTVSQNLEVVRIDAERNLILVKGNVPGAAGCYVTIKPAVKARSGGNQDAA